ncbi:hypothetical protein AYI69_g6663 [Smittium culicis]|uniref:Uncharacterized protein n=1 Tax=Smittium culicis TaxID=133412 RepID=A0A1R1XXD7_9FUNG|nr:hypothetical protein AYI69_g6663 [Smittium culicis]
MSATTPTSSNQSSPLRTPPQFGADYEEDVELQSHELGHHHAPNNLTEFLLKDPAPSSTLENTQKCRAKVDFDPERTNPTL